jgi:hypothetical protein
LDRKQHPEFTTKIDTDINGTTDIDGTRHLQFGKGLVGFGEKENLICLDRFVRRSFDPRKSPFCIVFRDVFAVLTSVAWIPLPERTIPTERNGFDSGSKS